jgi:hypothetical protein
MPFPCLEPAATLPLPYHDPVIVRTRAGCSHVVSGRPMLIHTNHAVPMQRCTVALRSRFQNGMVLEWQGNGIVCVNQTRSHCVNQMGNTQSKPLGERHGMCELTLTQLTDFIFFYCNEKGWRAESCSVVLTRSCVQAYWPTCIKSFNFRFLLEEILGIS